MILRKEKAHDMDVNSVQWGPGVSFCQWRCEVIVLLLVWKKYFYLGKMCSLANLVSENVTRDNWDYSCLLILLSNISLIFPQNQIFGFTWTVYSPVVEYCLFVKSCSQFLLPLKGEPFRTSDSINCHLAWRYLSCTSLKLAVKVRKLYNHHIQWQLVAVRRKPVYLPLQVMMGQ